MTRTYTLRGADPERQKVTIDFVVHGDKGIAAPWAAHAEPGDLLTMSGAGGASFRARISELIRTGRALARIEDGQVIFKAEVGAATPQACQVQGVWIRPEYRGRGLAAPGMAAVVVEAARSIAPLVSLYVNDFNLPARAAYRRVGFAETGRFMSVLF